MRDTVGWKTSKELLSVRKMDAPISTPRLEDATVAAASTWRFSVAAARPGDAAQERKQEEALATDLMSARSVQSTLHIDGIHAGAAMMRNTVFNLELTGVFEELLAKYGKSSGQSESYELREGPGRSATAA